MRARAFIPLVPAALLLAGCGGDARDGAPPAGAPPMRLVAYDGCDDLLNGLRTATAERVGPYGLGGVVPLMERSGGAPSGALPAPEAADGAAKGAAPQEHSRTNAHEAGADEPDTVKTDGRRIVALARGRLHVIDPATRRIVHRLDLPDLDRPGNDPRLLLHGDRALVLAAATPLLRDMAPADAPSPIASRTTLTLVDLAGTPKVVDTLTADAAYVDARQSGRTAHVVVRSTPRIDFPAVRRPGGEKQATERNREAVRKAPLSAWLPTFQTGGGTRHTVPCERVSRPADATGTSVVSVLTLDLTRPFGDPGATAVVGEGQTVYGNGSSLYITGTPPQPGTWGRPVRPQDVKERTDLHRFSVGADGRLRYEASGSVPGHLLNQYSMSEHGGLLRVATTDGTPFTRPGERAPRSQSAVRVLRQDGPSLKVAGTVDGLGRGERIHSVRFLGTNAYVVTFRQTDPLYVVDLRDPARPRVTGELKINGYSAYLHPVAGGRILGVGQDADDQGRTKGTQVSLFDVSGAPRRVGVFHLPGTGSQTEFDPHAFLYWPKTGLTVIPVNRHRDGTSQALALKVDGDGLRRAGTVEHPGQGYDNAIGRSLMVGDTLWTFSPNGARATDAATFRAGDWLRF
ncbi:beta-propeller domain-containing protein [Actinomadura kijaniata]|uniref:beta-propeller domain-containing protein n=1 Tax=Actinomadura kijaniata TaxID=46161 RepID=UPI003F1AF24F